MKTRPGVLIFLGIVQLLSPIGNILLSAVLSHLSVVQYVAILFKDKPYEFALGSVAAQLAAGLAILAVKPWSIPVCAAVTLYNIISTSSISQSYGAWYVAPFLVLSHLVNLGFVLYFLIPQVHRVYYNSRLRWWESKPRYRFDEKSLIFGRSQVYSCVINNISEGGVFAETSANFELGTPIVLEFTHNEASLMIKAKIVHKGARGTGSYGVQFVDLGSDSRRQIKMLIRALEETGVERRPERGAEVKEFKNWLKRVMTTGRGWFPELPAATVIAFPEVKPEQSAESTHKKASSA